MESVAAQIRANFAALGALSSALSLLDVLCAFAVRVMSSKGAYVRPVFGDDESPLAVEAGRYSSFYLFSPCWKLLDWRRVKCLQAPGVGGTAERGLRRQLHLPLSLVQHLDR